MSQMLYDKDRTQTIKHRKAIGNDLSCPKCGASSEFLYFFGHDSGFQKFRCSRCKRQFAPDKPLKPKKEPRFFCPICGRGAHITHIFSDGIRVRCNAHNHPNPQKRCKHLFNIPVVFDEAGNIIIKDSFQHMENPLDGSSLLDIDPTFHFSRMRHSMTTVALVTFFSLQARLPDTTVSYILKHIFAVDVHHSTINHWMDKVAVQLHNKQKTTIFPSSGYLQTDFTSIFIDGQQWYWCTVKDAFLPLIVAWVLSPNKDTTTARNAMHMAMAKIDKSGVIPDRPFWISDKAYAFAAALPDAMEGEAFYHHQVESFSDSIHNNAMERHYGDVKDITRRIRGMKSVNGALSFLSNQTYAFNFLLEKRSLHGQTTAQFLGIHTYDGYSKNHKALEVIKQLIA